jgi:hypothetical protein
VTDEKDIEAVLISGIYPDAHGRRWEKLTEVVEDAYSIRKEGVGICCHHHSMSDSLVVFHLKIVPARNY